MMPIVARAASTPMIGLAQDATALAKGVGSLDRYVISKPAQKPNWQSDLPRSSPLRDCGRKAERKGPLFCGYTIRRRHLGGEQARCFLQSESGRNQQFGEQSIALTVTSAPYRILTSIGVTTAQAYIPEEQEMIEAEEPNIAPSCTRFACPHGLHWHKPATVNPPPAHS